MGDGSTNDVNTALKSLKVFTGKTAGDFPDWREELSLLLNLRRPDMNDIIGDQ